MTDDRLVRTLRHRDGAAAAALYERHGRAVYRWALAVLGRPHDAEEVVQATMLRAIEALRADPPRHFEAWLRVVTRNESIDLLRRRRDHSPVEDHDEHAAPSAADVAGMRADVRQVLEDLAALPDRQRAALVLRELHQLSHREVADALAIRPGAVRQAVVQARHSLRERAEGRGMPCASVRVLLEDGDRRRRRSLAVQAHLAACTRCADVATARLRAAVPGPWLAALVGRLSPGGTGTRIAAGVAASAAVVAGGAGVWSRFEPGPSPGREATVIAADAIRDAAPPMRVGVRDRVVSQPTTGRAPRSAAGSPGPAEAAPRQDPPPSHPDSAAPGSPPAPAADRRPSADPSRSQWHNPGHYVAVGDEEVDVENSNAPGAGVTVDPENGTVGVEVGGCVYVPPLFGGCPEEEDDQGTDEP